MPRDLKEFHTDVLQHPGRMYIQKPVASSRGRGIRMVKVTLPPNGTVHVHMYGYIQSRVFMQLPTW